MSETETQDLITRGLAALNAGNIDGAIACLSEEVAVDVPGQERQIGRDNARWGLANLARHFRAEASDIAVMTAPGGLRAAAEFTLSGTYLATLAGLPPANSQSFQVPAGLFLDIDDEGLISRLTICCDPKRLSAALAKG